jgi:hypothetical protein
VHKSHDLLQEEIVAAIYNMAQVSGSREELTLAVLATSFPCGQWVKGQRINRSLLSHMERLLVAQVESLFFSRGRVRTQYMYLLDCKSNDLPT